MLCVKAQRSLIYRCYHLHSLLKIVDAALREQVPGRLWHKPSADCTEEVQGIADKCKVEPILADHPKVNRGQQVDTGLRSVPDRTNSRLQVLRHHLEQVQETNIDTNAAVGAHDKYAD